MEGDLRINVPPADKHGISQCYGPAITAIRRPESQEANCWDESKEKGKTSELGNRFFFNSHTAFLFVLMCT